MYRSRDGFAGAPPLDVSAEVLAQKGDVCLICKTDEQCGPDTVGFGINFFKIHTIDLKSTAFTFSAWVRQDWTDKRLSYDPQCYGGLESSPPWLRTLNFSAKKLRYLEVVADTGGGAIWTPDTELYNSEQPIWQGSLGARMANVYGCWDGAP